MDVGELKAAKPPCSGMTEKFFIITNVDFSGKNIGPKKLNAIQEIETAKAICSGCHVQPECLAGAVERNEQVGIWGGVNFFSTSERKKARSLV